VHQELLGHPVQVALQVVREHQVLQEVQVQVVQVEVAELAVHQELAVLDLVRLQHQQLQGY
jgi:hypothetical protein